MACGERLWTCLQAWLIHQKWYRTKTKLLMQQSGILLSNCAYNHNPVYSIFLLRRTCGVFHIHTSNGQKPKRLWGLVCSHNSTVLVCRYFETHILMRFLLFPVFDGTRNTLLKNSVSWNCIMLHFLGTSYYYSILKIFLTNLAKQSLTLFFKSQKWIQSVGFHINLF